VGGDVPCGAVGPMVRSSSNRLNLAGLLLLLIVLDGVVSTPERIVLMITSHPEILVSTRP
jgi:hypothetical protein